MRIGITLALACGVGLAGCGDRAPEPGPEAPGTAEPAATEPAAVEPAAGLRTPAPENAALYFIAPADGAEVASPVNIVFGLSGAGVAPAGVVFPDTGHHHVLVNTGMPPEDIPIPEDANHLHFGLGQSEAMVELPPGEHELQLLLGDHLHIPHDPPVASEVITVTVVE